MKVSAIIVAGGKGKRYGKDKLLEEIKGKKVIEWSVESFIENETVEEVIVVCPEEKRGFFKNKKVVFAEPGEERFFSVYNGLKKAKGEKIIIHDAARPFVEKKVIDEGIEFLDKYDVVFTGMKVRDTTRYYKDGKIKTIDRKDLYLVQTPQFFKKKILEEAFLMFLKEKNFIPTDEVMLVEKIFGEKVKYGVIEGSLRLLKITYKEDFEVLKTLVDGGKHD